MELTVGNISTKKETKRKESAANQSKSKPLESNETALYRVLSFQRNVGNSLVTQLLRPRAIQAKLTVGAPNDIYEKEADRLADRVMRMPSGGCSGCSHESMSSNSYQNSSPTFLVNSLQPLSKGDFTGDSYNLNIRRKPLSPRRAVTVNRDIQFTNDAGEQIILDPMHRVEVLRIENNQFRIRVVEGRHDGAEGTIPASGVEFLYRNIYIDDEEGLVLVFFQNTERSNENDVIQSGAGIVTRATSFIAEFSGQTVQLKVNTHVYLRNPHSEGKYRIIFDGRVGEIPRDCLISDAAFRRGEMAYFRDLAFKKAQETRSLYVDPSTKECLYKHYPIEYYSGMEILSAIQGAAHCANRKVKKIYIYGHGGRSSLGGTGDVDELNGLYSENDSRPDEGKGIRTREFVRGASNSFHPDGVEIWIYACHTGEVGGLSSELAQLLGEEISSGTSRVHGFMGSGNLERDDEFVTYTSE